jgi:hypoxanthine phosphoribosyltransferase
MKLSWEDCHYMTILMKRQMNRDGWSPEYIIGLSRGGNVPATIFSHLFNVPARILNVSFRDFPEQDDMDKFFSWAHLTNKNVLVVDDINDSGKTLEYVRNTYKHWMAPEKVRYAALVHNIPSVFPVNYFGKTIDKSQHDVWVTFPWEMKIEN